MNTMNENSDTIQFSEGIEKIREKILDPNIKVVSFDIFDTLLFRPVLNPLDVFRVIENKLNIPKFYYMRITAEAEARRFKSLWVEDVTLEDIYKTYARLFNVDEAEKNALMKEELDIEYQFLHARKSAQYLYRQALEAGKEVIIVSDMYLTSEFLNKCLEKNGYVGHSRLYVSSETGVMKSSKKMYQRVISDFAEQGISSSEILHIGDNKKSDVDCALEMGITACHLPKPMDIRLTCKQLKKMNAYIMWDALNSNNSILYGILINLYFDDPFVNYEKASYFNGEAKLMGYWFSPLMISFTKWLIECVEKEKVEQLLWVWRDGYLPSKLLEILRPLCTERSIDIDTIYLGRALRVPYQILEKNGFFSTFIDYPLDPGTSIDFFIRERMFCENQDEYKEILNIFFKHGYVGENAKIGKFDRYRGFLNELEPYARKNVEKKLDRYGKYINSKIDRDKKVAVFDRALQGKTSRFLKQHFDIDSICLTTEVYDTPKAKLEDINLTVNSYLEYGSYYINKMSGIWGKFFERLISDTHPGFGDVVENSNGTVSVELETVKSDDGPYEADEIMQTVQRAIIEFTEKCASVLGEYFQYINIERHGIFDYAIDVFSTPHIKDAEMIVKLKVDKSSVVPVGESSFLDWFNKKFKKQIKKVTTNEDTLMERIRVKGYIISEKLGILSQMRSLYRFLIRKPQKPQVSYELIQTQTDAYISQLNTLNCKNIDVLFVGSVPRDLGKFFNCFSRINEKLKIIFVAAGFTQIPTYFDFPCIEAPEIFNFGWIEGADKEIEIPLEIKQFVNSKQYLRDVVERRILKGYSESMAILLAYEGERYYSALIKTIAPRMVMTWNNCGNNSSIPAEIARLYGINVLSAERGFLEGTIMLSENGYGKDDINIKPEEFCKLPVNNEELQKAEDIIEFLRDTGLNRYNQPVNEKLEELKRRLPKDRPNIVIIGSFDCENPAFPHNGVNEEFYSPVFSRSREVVLKVAQIAKKNNWNVIFKPHPLIDKMVHSKEGSHFPKNVYCIREANINELIDMSDVVIGMISGVSYITLTRGKPLVQLAYTPLKGKKCCYEAYSVNTIEAAIREAIEKGFTDEQKKAFVQHVAQVNKYYYFDDLGVRPIRYGRSIEEAAQIFNSTMNEKNLGGN